MRQVGPALPKGTVDRPYHVASTMPNYKLDPRSRSKTTTSTYSTLGMDSESKSSGDKSSRRRSQDVRSIAGSIQSRADRSDSMAKSLFSRGTKLLKRENSSKSNLTSLRTLDWVEASYERDQIQELAGWRLLKHSRIDSAGNSKEIKQTISEPYNFQHLTHAHARQFQELERTRDNELVSEFSAIRASQAPRRELRGIKAQCLHSRNTSSEALEQLSPPKSHTGLITPPTLSPTRPRDRPRNTPPSNTKEGKAVRTSPSIDNFSHPGPRGNKLPTPPVSPPPARAPSRTAFSPFRDPLLSYQPSPTASTSEQSIAGYSFATSDSASALNSPAEITSAQKDSVRVDPLDIGHAMTTPDDSALTLRPLPFNLSGTELADLPEEVESFYFKRTSTRHSRIPSTDSGIHHSKPSPRSPSRANAFLHPSLGVVSEAPGSPALGPGAAIDPTLPNPMDPCDLIARPSLMRRATALPKGFDESWEDDIDWCYEHAAEADCEFEWDCQSRDGDEVAASSTLTAGTSTDAHTTRGSGLDDNKDPLANQRNAPVPASAVADCSKSQVLNSRNTPDLAIPELEYLLTDSAQSSAISLPETVTYSQLHLPSHLTGKTALNGPPSNVVRSPHSVYITIDHEAQMIDETLYQEKLSEEYFSEHFFQVYDDSIDASGTFDNSPRSSHSPPSTCQSRESVNLSVVEPLARRRRENNSSCSLPELVHSKSSRERFDLVAIQLAEQIASLRTTEATSNSLSSGTRRRKRGATLATDIAHQSILKKANSCGNLLECQEATTAVAASSIHHGRAHSDGPTRQMGGPSYPSPQKPTLRRMHSAGAGILLSKPSYTLFPATSPRASPSP
ncbi:MAG: hypothetical protein FRX48_04196 [Lasallia pustulata]|uniref:CRIB domain-containing protein n=1 Tax=Lasallia pustulata TaxID=136370 RepID=A0A5M8PTN2_9LECA|nr:MAG: hypothetical protein FRX48_04196 [Lasallia pustulata]